MSKTLPTPPRRNDLVESFDALSLAGKKPIEKKLPDPPSQQDCKKPIEKKLPDPPSQQDYQTTFVGGFRPEMLGLKPVLDTHRLPPAVNQNARRASSSKTKAHPVPSPKRIPMPVPIPVPQTSMQSLTMQYAFMSLGPNAPTNPVLAPPFVPAPPRLHSDSTTVTPSRPSTPSVTSSRATSSPGTNRTRCSGMTKARKQCSRQVKLPATHSLLDPTPVLYCHQHKVSMITAQTGFYVQKIGNPDKFVEFDHYIPNYLRMDTQLALKVEMEKATSAADVPGYIYTIEIRDPKRPNVIQLKVGRAVNLIKRLDQWDKQCGSKVQIPRGWWPGTVKGTSLLKGNIDAGDPGPFCHRVERLVHIELADLSLHAPYLNPDWPNNVCDASTSPARKTTAKEITCLDCGAVHREIFTFPRPEKGRYKGKEWDLIVKPVIEKWGRFVKEYYA